MTTDSGKKPREFWILPQKGNDCDWTNLYPDESWKSGTKPLIHVREVTPCPNCERLEDKLYHESRRADEVVYLKDWEIKKLQNQLYKTEESSANQYQKVQRLQAQLSMCKEVLEFYADGGNPNRDIWLDEELGYFTGKHARECLFKLEKE